MTCWRLVAHFSFRVMSTLASRLCPGIPKHLLVTLLLAAGFMLFVSIDQMHWWRLKPDYSFGWLVPFLVGYVIYDRWPSLRVTLAAAQREGGKRTASPVIFTMAALVLSAGLGLFMLGAFYRAGAGTTQPGSAAMAVGLAAILPGIIYLNSPGGRDARLRVVALFCFPALVWMVSAPLVTAVENAVSLFLLRKVVAVVFAVFNLLGYTLVQEGSVLVLPLGKVGVADACSGIRSLTGCLFAGSFLAAISMDRLWQKLLLIGLSLMFAFMTNLLRSLFLTAWAYAYGSDAIEGTIHDASGFAVLGLTVVGLLCLMPLLRVETWRSWFVPESLGAVNRVAAK